MNVRMTPISPTLSLKTLLSEVATGSRSAFRKLYDHTNAKLYGVIGRILSRSDLAADALQETYVRIWQKAGMFDSTKSTPLTWMATIARNQAIEEIRRSKRIPLIDMGEDFDPPAEEYDPLSSRERSERFKAVMHFLSKLDIEKRDLIMLAYYRGVSREALSKRFSIPVPTIKTQLRRTLAQLKSCLLTDRTEGRTYNVHRQF